MPTKLIHLVICSFLGASYTMADTPFTNPATEALFLLCPKVETLRFDYRSGRARGVDNLGNVWNGEVRDRFDRDTGFLSYVYSYGRRTFRCAYFDGKAKAYLYSSEQVAKEYKPGPGFNDHLCGTLNIRYPVEYYFCRLLPR